MLWSRRCQLQFCPYACCATLDKSRWSLCFLIKCVALKILTSRAVSQILVT